MTALNCPYMVKDALRIHLTNNKVNRVTIELSGDGMYKIDKGEYPYRLGVRSQKGRDAQSAASLGNDKGVGDN